MSEENKEFEVYVEFTDSKNGFKPSRKDFYSYDAAWAWICETFDTPNKDFINYIF